MKKLGKFKLDNIYCGNCKELTKDIPDNSIDLIVTDPPYQLSSTSRARPDQTKEGSYGREVPFSRQQSRIKKGFMGKKWDILPPIEVWKESLRILKPGAFAFIMTTPRQDSLSQILMDLTNAGFFMGFSSIYWTYASGMPKASNIGKMVDKQECKKQLFEKLGRKPTKEEFKKAWEGFREIINIREKDRRPNIKIMQNKPEAPFKLGLKPEGTGIDTAPATPQAKALNGSYGGFQPKPAVEIIIVAMKPLSEKTYVDQALKNKKGITYLDDCRIPYESEGTIASNPKLRVEKGCKTETGDRIFCQGELGKKNTMVDNVMSGGRFPANLLVSDDVLNDGRNHIGWTGQKHKTEFSPYGGSSYHKSSTKRKGEFKGYDKSGSYSRYFDLDKWAVAKGVKDTFPFLIVPKASKSEKNRGLENLPEKPRKLWKGSEGHKGVGDYKPDGSPRANTKHKNIHPTVKPIKLFFYLITLGSRKGDIILDPFIGSGTTAIACKILNRRYLGFEISKEYVEIANARLKAVKHVQEKLL